MSSLIPPAAAAAAAAATDTFSASFKIKQNRQVLKEDPPQASVF